MYFMIVVVSVVYIHVVVISFCPLGDYLALVLMSVELVVSWRAE